MNEAAIRAVFKKLDIRYARTISGWVMGHCPYAPYRHARGTDKSGDFGIKIEDDGVSYINCFACKAKGTVATLCYGLAHLRQEPELTKYGKKIEQDELVGGSFEFGEWEDEEGDDQETPSYRPTRFPDEGDFLSRYPSLFTNAAATKYVLRRGISATTCFSLGLRYDHEQGRVLFPVYDYWTGRFAGCSGRSIRCKEWVRQHVRAERKRNAKYKYPKIRDYAGLQKDRLLLFERGCFGTVRQLRRGSHVGRAELPSKTGKRILVVEGLFGFANTWQLRPGGTVVALLGSALTLGKEEILRDIGAPIFWFTDPDQGGEQCLKGPYDPIEDEYDLKNGALHKLYGDVAQFVPKWRIDDIDNLTKAEFNWMLDHAELYLK